MAVPLFLPRKMKPAVFLSLLLSLYLLGGFGPSAAATQSQQAHVVGGQLRLAPAGEASALPLYSAPSKEGDAVRMDRMDSEDDEDNGTDRRFTQLVRYFSILFYAFLLGHLLSRAVEKPDRPFLLPATPRYLRLRVLLI